jgi:hypothetical protein
VQEARLRLRANVTIYQAAISGMISLDLANRQDVSLTVTCVFGRVDACWRKALEAIIE